MTEQIEILDIDLIPQDIELKQEILIKIRYLLDK